MTPKHPEIPQHSRAAAFKRTPRYLLHPSNAPTREERPRFEDEFAQRQRERLRSAVIEDCIGGLEDIRETLGGLRYDE